MGIWDYAIVAVIGVLFVSSVLYIKRSRKQGGGCHGCSGCTVSGCQNRKEEKR